MSGRSSLLTTLRDAIIYLFMGIRLRIPNTKVPQILFLFPDRQICFGTILKVPVYFICPDSERTVWIKTQSLNYFRECGLDANFCSYESNSHVLLL